MSLEKSSSLLNLIFQRRSIRRFTGEPVSREQIVSILQAAMAAPSARNGRPWEFLVITEPDRIRAVCEAHPRASWGVNAGAVIIPFYRGPADFYVHQDMAASTENLLLAVTALGLGATWCGMTPERQALVRAVVEVPEDAWLFAVIPIGVPAEVKEPRTQYDEAKVWWERCPR